MARVRPDLLEPGDFPVVFGRYTLLRLLGEGGMARVFEAELQGPSGFRKRLAVKVIRKAIGGPGHDKRLRLALIHEARLGGMLHHPNVVETYDFGETDKQAWIAMELIRGLGLETVMGGAGRLPPDVALEICAQVCAGLHHAHTLTQDGEPAPLVHRDLKPSNIIVGDSGLVKVLDFGIAKATHLHGNTTETGMTKGTPAYMSPEQASGGDIDRRSDIFAVGALLWELLLGERFFSGDTVYAVMMKILQIEKLLADEARWQRVDRIVPGVSPVIRRCLRANRQDRYDTAQDVERDIRRLQGAVTPPGPIALWLRDRHLVPVTEALEALSLDAVPAVEDLRRPAASGMMTLREEPSQPDTGGARFGAEGTRVATGAGGIDRTKLQIRTGRRPVAGLADGGAPQGGDAARAGSAGVAGSEGPAADPGAGATRPQQNASPSSTRIMDGDPPRKGGVQPALVVIGGIVLLALGLGAGLLMRSRPAASPPQASSPTPRVQATTPSPTPQSAPTPLAVAAPTSTPAPARPRSSDGPSARPAPSEPSPSPLPTATPAPTPTARPRPTPRATPRPPAATAKLTHRPPDSVILGGPTSISFRLDPPTACRPTLSYGPWSGGSLSAASLDGGDGRWEAEVYVPYEPAWQQGMRYRIVCTSGGETVATWPAAGGVQRVPSLAR